MLNPCVPPISGSWPSNDKIRFMPTSNVYPPSAEFVRRANVKGMEGYRELYERAAGDPEEFWGELAARELHWFRSGRTCSNGIRPSPSGSWTARSTSPTTAWTGTWRRRARTRSPFCGKASRAISGMISYQELHRLVCRFANVLKARGLKAGDRAIIYMGMVPELPVALLACARLGIIHQRGVRRLFGRGAEGAHPGPGSAGGHHLRWRVAARQGSPAEGRGGRSSGRLPQRAAT